MTLVPTAECPTITYWVDGGVLGRNPSPRGVYWSMRCSDGIFKRRLRSERYHSNNDAEWLALREALSDLVARHRGRSVTVCSDSRLIVNQFNGVWRAKIERHARLRIECRLIAADHVGGLRVEWRPRTVIFRRLGH